MERSLRAAGCSLPLSVIPYDDNLFELPANAEWVDLQPFAEMLQPWSQGGGHFRKFVTVLSGPTAFFDADIIHLKNPEEWLAPFADDDFVVADTEFSKATWTYTARTKQVFQQSSANWLAKNFNTGFFACHNSNLTADVLAQALRGAEGDLLENRHIAAEQPALNYLVHSLKLRVVNACLPPYRFESTMALDYGDNYKDLLSLPNGAPFIHYAGRGRDLDAPISQLIFQHLTNEEVAQLWAKAELIKKEERSKARWPYWARFMKRAIPMVDSRFELTWRAARSRI